MTASVVAAGPVLLEIGDPRWRSFVAAREEAVPFHEPAWAELLGDCYRHRPFVLALTNADGTLAAGLPLLEIRGPLGRRRWVSLPFTDVCPPLVSHDGLEERLVSALEAARRKAGVFVAEVRAPVNGAGVHHRSDSVLHTLELGPDPDAVFATFHRSQVQRNVLRAERERIVVRRGETEADLARTFYALHLETRRRLGVPVQPHRFFIELWRRLLDPGLGFLLLAYAGRRPVAGAVFLGSGRRSLIYKYGASNRAFSSLRPNHLVFWTAIRGACETGYETLDFGRTDSVDAGLRRFKCYWGTREEPLVYSSLSDRPPANAHGQAAHAARSVIRRSPAWVCRAAGELLYRYAA